MPLPMNVERLTSIVGRSFVDHLTDSGRFPALVIGRDHWSKAEIAAMGIVQTRACSILTSIAKRLGVTSTRDLYNTTSPYTFASHPAGVTTLFVMFAAFREKGLDADAWYHRDDKAAGTQGAIVSFLALKHRELVAERRTREDAKRRTRAKRRREHARAVASIEATT